MGREAGGARRSPQTSTRAPLPSLQPSRRCTPAAGRGPAAWTPPACARWGEGGEGGGSSERGNGTEPTPSLPPSPFQAGRIPGTVLGLPGNEALAVTLPAAEVDAALRAVWLAALFAPLATSASASMAKPIGDAARAAWAAGLRTRLERAGPAFIKWGQWAATRHDLFPPDLCAELERLHSAAPAHARAVTAASVREAFGSTLDDLFEGFPDAPVASGSVGQVYRARLSAAGARRAGLKPGTVVAVKVRHPGVDTAIARDFAIMAAAANVATRLIPALADARLDETLAQFEAPLREQVDFTIEARSLWRFCYNFRDRPGVRFPQPVYPLVSPGVLVETFEGGGAIADHVAAGPSGRHAGALARLGTDAVLRMLLVDNFVCVGRGEGRRREGRQGRGPTLPLFHLNSHSDLHPGNILVRLDPPKTGLAGAAASALRAAHVPVPRSWLRPSLVLLDVGMTTSLSEADRDCMYHLFAAFARGDGAAVAERALQFSGPSQSCPRPPTFRDAMERSFDALNAERSVCAASCLAAICTRPIHHAAAARRSDAPKSGTVGSGVMASAASNPATIQSVTGRAPS